jgi:predicted nucleic acid-binding protein
MTAAPRDEWLRHDLLLRFEGRVLSIDNTVADAWSRVVAYREALGRRIEPMDAFIAATAQVHELTLVTRHTSDFQSSVEATVNPWSQT